MRFSVLAGAVLTGIPSAMADQRSWELVTGVCNTGFGEGGSWPWRLVKLAGTSGCSGCDLWNVQTNMWKSPNPCKRCNSGDIFDYVKNGSGMNVYAEGDHSRIIAHCAGSNGPNQACNFASGSCSGPVVYKCSGDLHCD